MAEPNCPGHHARVIVASGTATITCAMLCFIHPLFTSITREWEFGSLDPYVQVILFIGVCMLFAIGAGVTHLHGAPRRRISIIAAFLSVGFLIVAFPFIFITRDAIVILLIILAFMATISITSFALIEPLTSAARFILECPGNEDRVLRSITAGILLGGVAGGLGYLAGSVSLYGLFTAWAGVALAGASTISLARRLPASENIRFLPRQEARVEAKYFFSEILFTSVLAMPGTVMLSAESGRLGALLGGPLLPLFTILGPVSVSIAAIAETITTVLRKRRARNPQSTMANSYAFLLATAIFVIGMSFVNFRYIGVAAWIVHGAGQNAPVILVSILVTSTFWATPLLMAMQRAFFTLARSKLPGWVNGFGLALFWFVISITQAYATEIGNFFFNDLGAWILGVTLACSVSGILVIAGVAINRSGRSR